jgi:hypothetical protein
MTTKRRAAYGIYPRQAALPEVVGALNQAGFENTDICMVLSPAHPDAAAVSDTSIFEVDAEDRALSARMIGWFSKFGAVVIPTVGFFVRSQSYLDALVSEKTSETLSHGSRTLLGLGFPQSDAERLGHQLCDVGALVYVSCPESSQVDGTIELLRCAGAREAASFDLMKAVAATTA